MKLKRDETIGFSPLTFIPIKAAPGCEAWRVIFPIRKRIERFTFKARPLP